MMNPIAMKTRLQNLFLMLACAGLPVMPAAAQTFANLHSFDAVDFSTYTNMDGAKLYCSLALSGQVLYGTTLIGGLSGNGTVFRVGTDGTGFTNLYNFSGPATGNYLTITNSDGANPQAGLILAGNTLYGTATQGGTAGNGSVFAINTDGTGFTNLHNFTMLDSGASTNSDGAYPQAGLILSGDTLYGTTVNGGGWGSGTVFAMNTNGMGFTNLHSFTAVDPVASPNGDGANPQAGLILSGNILYGTAAHGGAAGSGTVFAVKTDGTGFTNLYNFTVLDPNVSTNSDGANPQSELTLSAGVLYGTTTSGGSSGNGTVFALNTDGTGFTNLHTFTALDPDAGTNSDGASPLAGMILADNLLYGTATSGGDSGNGTVFAIKTDGTGFTTIYSLAGDINGSRPFGSLISSGDTLFGTTWGAGKIAAATPAAELFSACPWRRLPRRN